MVYQYNHVDLNYGFLASVQLKFCQLKLLVQSWKCGVIVIDCQLKPGQNGSENTTIYFCSVNLHIFQCLSVWISSFFSSSTVSVERLALATGIQEWRKREEGSIPVIRAVAKVLHFRKLCKLGYGIKNVRKIVKPDNLIWYEGGWLLRHQGQFTNFYLPKKILKI